MSSDISQLLSEWPYTPGQFNVRLIEGDDGEPRVQIRLDLGILQLHVRGRPDGQRPHGHDSFLEYVEASREPDPADADAPPEHLDLSEDECRLLREEAAQYYHRYMALLVLEEFDGVIRDTTRNLRVLELCAEHGASESDRQMLEPYRPYILMIRSRALAGQMLKDGEAKAAVLAIDDGLDALRGHFAEIGHPEQFDSSSEAQVLRSMREALIPKLPVSQRSELRQRLQAALEQENYELAAILRDELRMLRDEREEQA